MKDALHAYEIEVAAELARVDTDWAAVYRLRDIEERWFRRMLKLPPKQDVVIAVRGWTEKRLERISGWSRTKLETEARAAQMAEVHLAEAERWQWEIGTSATGAGEGLASMADVRSLQAARAWLAFVISCMQVDLAVMLAAEIEGDPNRSGERHRKSLGALRRLVGKQRRPSRAEKPPRRGSRLRKPT